MVHTHDTEQYFTKLKVLKILSFKNNCAIWSTILGPSFTSLRNIITKCVVEIEKTALSQCAVAKTARKLGFGRCHCIARIFVDAVLPSWYRRKQGRSNLKIAATPYFCMKKLKMKGRSRKEKTSIAIRYCSNMVDAECSYWLT